MATSLRCDIALLALAAASFEIPRQSLSQEGSTGASVQRPPRCFSKSGFELAVQKNDPN